MAYTHITPGSEIELSCHVYHSAGALDISDIVTLPLDELTKQEQASIDKEKTIFSKIHDVETEWAQQAMQTIRLRQAQQYLKTQPVEHTANQWIVDQHGRHEVSNMTYQMIWRVYEHTRYDRKADKSVITAWELSWHLVFNTTPNPDKTGNGRQLAGQDRKRFTDKAAMDKYLQGRINAYAHLFMEISPPIPKGEEKRFSVNGILLPGYTVEVPEPTPQEVADSLLDLLDDEDLGLPSQPEEAEPPPAVPPPQPSPTPHRKHAPKTAQAHKPKRSAPTR